jgi:hypothetical protein
MLYYHRIGTPQSEDILVHKDDEHPTWMWSAGLSETDGRYLELYTSQDTGAVCHILVLPRPNPQTLVCRKTDSGYVTSTQTRSART